MLAADRTMRPLDVLLLALCFGALAGFTEVAVWGVRKFYLAKMIRMGPHVTWMAPLMSATLFLGVGLLLAGAGAIWRRLLWRPLPLFVFSFMALLAPIGMSAPLHRYAQVLLSAGLAAHVARVLSARPQGVARVVRRSILPLGALVTIVGIYVAAKPRLTESAAMRALPQPAPGRPNVLLITLDTVRASSLSLHGYGRATTPKLAEWAKRGVVFERAVATAPWTLPTHGSLMTGRWCHEITASLDTPMDATHPTIGETMQRYGYATGGFVGNTVYCSYETGLQRGFTHYEDYMVSFEDLLLSSSFGRELGNHLRVRCCAGFYEVMSLKTAEQINQRFLSWTSTLGGGGDNEGRGRPFFAFLNYYDAHNPNLLHEPFRSRFARPGSRVASDHAHVTRGGLAVERFNMSQAEVDNLVDCYDGSIAYMDHHLDALFRRLDADGILANTMVIITSDHGEQFGEHGLHVHGNSLYEPLLHVPLIVLYPAAVPAGVRVPTPVTLRDVPATIVELAKLERDATTFPGQSLSRHWSGGTSGDAHGSGDMILSEVRHATWGQSWYPASKGDMRSVRLGDYKLIQNADATEELYDLSRDREELQNLVAAPEHQATTNRMRRYLAGLPPQSADRNAP